MKKEVLFLIILIILTSIVYSANVENEVYDSFEDGKVNVIVKLKDDVVQEPIGVMSDKDFKKDKLESKKVMIKKQQDKVLKKFEKKELGVMNSNFKLGHKYSTVNGFSAEVDLSILEELKNDENVELIQISKEYHVLLNSAVPVTNSNDVWGIQFDGINLTGKGETVCILDTGIDFTHDDLGNGWGFKVLDGYRYLSNGADTADCSVTPASCMDGHGHGTHVAGIVASENKTYRGVAPDANLIAIKILSDSGRGWDSDIISGIDWCIDNKDTYNISVISMSLGDCSNHTTYCNGDTMASIINTAVANGITVTVAAGNGPGGSCTGITNVDGPSSPACVENSMAIGAVNDADTIFYQRGALFELMAPGISIISTASGVEGGTFVSKQGTSMATPHAAGIIALVQQFNRLQGGSGLSSDELKILFNDTGVFLNDSGGSGYNFMRIDALEAIIASDITGPNISVISPLNLSSTLSNIILFNLTIDDQFHNISSCLLELNGVNYSMDLIGTGNNVNCNLTKTIWGHGLVSYVVYSNDSLGNWGNVSLNFEINDTAPIINTIYPNVSSLSITEPNNQTFNITYSDVNNDSLYVYWYRNGSLVGNESEYDFIGSYLTAGSYNITAIISDGSLNVSNEWILFVNNTNIPPTVFNLQLISTDSGNRTNGTLIGSFNYSDSDNETIVLNETKWFNGSIEIVSLRNLSLISDINKNESWIFSARAYDGENWSLWENSSTLTILNSEVILDLISDISINETLWVNISVNASDNDGLVYDINNSLFSFTGQSFQWKTNLSSAGNYSIRINVTDGSSVDYQDVLVEVVNAIDTDGDGDPDFNDTDTDNDGLNNSVDTLNGNLSNINSNVNISLLIGGSSNLTQIFNDLLKVNITYNNESLVSFDWNFSDSTLTVGWTIDYNPTTGMIRVKGITGVRKTVYINKANSKYNYVCLADDEITGYELLDDSCGGYKKFKCPGSSGQHLCTVVGDRFKISGLDHSAIRGIQVTTSGGGGGGGSSPTVQECTYDWLCSAWLPTECPSSGVQSRVCNNYGTCVGVEEKPDELRYCDYVPVKKEIEIQEGVVEPVIKKEIVEPEIKLIPKEEKKFDWVISPETIGQILFTAFIISLITIGFIFWKRK